MKPQERTKTIQISKCGEEEERLQPKKSPQNTKNKKAQTPDYVKSQGQENWELIAYSENVSSYC